LGNSIDQKDYQEYDDKNHKYFDELGFSEPVHTIELMIEDIYLFEQCPEAKMEAA